MLGSGRSRTMISDLGHPGEPQSQARAVLGVVGVDITLDMMNYSGLALLGWERLDFPFCFAADLVFP